MTSAVSSRSRISAAFGSRCTRSDHAITLLAAALTVLFFGLGSYNLGGPSLGFDEGFTAMVGQMGLRDGLKYLVTWDAHPPLHYLLLHFWIRLAGDSEFAMRFLSLASATMIVPLTYQTGRALLGRELGAVGASVVAVNVLGLLSAHQARMYSLATVSSLLVVCLICRWLRCDGRGSIGDWLLLLTAVLTSVYTLYYTAFVLIYIALVVLIWCWRARPSLAGRLRLLLPYIGVAFLSIAAFAPWIPSLVAQASLSGPGAWRTFVPAPRMLARTWEALALGISADQPSALWQDVLAVGLAAICAFGVAYTLYTGLRAARGAIGSRASAGGKPAGNDAPRRVFASAVSVAYLLVPLVVIQVISSWQPIFHERYVTILIPAFALLIGIGLLAIRRLGVLPFALALLLVAGSQASSLLTFSRDQPAGWEDYRGMISYLSGNLRPGDVILLSSGATWPVFQYYFHDSLAWRGPLQSYQPPAAGAAEPALVQIGSISSTPGLRLITPEDEPQTPEQAESNLARAVAGARRVWYFKSYETITDSRRVVHTWLDRNLFETDSRWFAGPAYLQLYSYSTWPPRRDEAARSSIPVAADFANGASIVAYEALPADPRPGEVALLSVYWRAREAIGSDFQVVAQLVDRSGRSWAQFDGAPLLWRYPTTRWQPGETIRDDYAVTIPKTLPVGVYKFEVGMYDLASQQRVSLAGEGDRNSFPLGSVIVRPRAPASSCAGNERRIVLGPIALTCSRVVQTEVRRGDLVEVAFNWEAIGEPIADYSVFVHLLDQQGRLAGQSDGEPMEGRFPTSVWRAGDAVSDRHALRIGADVEAGDYRVVVGMYRPSTMQRLPVDGSADGVAAVGSVRVGE